MEIFLVSFFFLALAKPLIFKLCSLRLDHRTAPVFISFFTLTGLLVTLPWFAPLMQAGTKTLVENPFLLGLCLFKGVVFWHACYNGQRLMQKSLSSTHFILPPAIAVASLINAFLGEALTMQEWVSVAGLCSLGFVFYFRGHLQEVPGETRKIYLLLVALTVIMLICDHYIIKQSNWFVYLFYSNAALLVFCLLKRKGRAVWRSALMTWPAIAAGVTFAVFEIVKFYPMVTYIPVAVMTSVQFSVIPLVLISSALLWKERTWQEQLVWGGFSLFFFALLLV